MVFTLNVAPVHPLDRGLCVPAVSIDQHHSRVVGEGQQLTQQTLKGPPAEEWRACVSMRFRV
jgi:hypothetical protein